MVSELLRQGDTEQRLRERGVKHSPASLKSGKGGAQINHPDSTRARFQDRQTGKENSKGYFLLIVRQYIFAHTPVLRKRKGIIFV